jgi:hypothetical protein
MPCQHENFLAESLDDRGGGMNTRSHRLELVRGPFSLARWS